MVLHVASDPRSIVRIEFFVPQFVALRTHPALTAVRRMIWWPSYESCDFELQQDFEIDVHLVGHGRVHFLQVWRMETLFPLSFAGIGVEVSLD